SSGRIAPMATAPRRPFAETGRNPIPSTPDSLPDWLQVPYSGHTAPGWSFLSRDGFRVMLGECTDATPPHALGDHAWYAYVTVDDAAALFAEYRAAGVEFTQSLADKPWGMREFGIRTIDGHRIMFGQEL
ncbi:MAG: VOC family protein, partial [Pseudomonadota bacterium]